MRVRETKSYGKYDRWIMFSVAGLLLAASNNKLSFSSPSPRPSRSWRWNWSWIWIWSRKAAAVLHPNSSTQIPSTVITFIVLQTATSRSWLVLVLVSWCVCSISRRISPPQRQGGPGHKKIHPCVQTNSKKYKRLFSAIIKSLLNNKIKVFCVKWEIKKYK